MNVKAHYVIPLFVAMSLIPAGLVYAAPDEPTVAGPFDEIELFGDAHNVSLLGALLDDHDPMTREQAVKGLGETHNFAAIELIRKMQSDADVNVRCAVATAAGEYDFNLAGDVILRSLASGDTRVVLAGLRSVRRTGFTAAGDDIRKLLDRPSPQLAAVALNTLTQLGQGATADQLKPLLASPSIRLRLRAGENAALLESPSPLNADLEELARDASPAVRAAALAALGRISQTAAAPFLADAKKDPSPLARRGALWAYENAGLTSDIRPFLDDPSPLVRLAAVRAAGNLKNTDCIERAFEIMEEAPDEELHLAARTALRQMGETNPGAVIAQAGKMLTRLAGSLHDVNAKIRSSAQSAPIEELLSLVRKREHVRRNASACSWLLGEFKSTVAYDVQLSLLNKLPPNSTVLFEVPPALGKIGDRRAVAPLIAKLDICKKCAILCMKAEIAGAPCPVPHFHGDGKETTAALIDGLCRLGATDAVKLITETASIKVGSLRLDRAAEIAGEMLPALDGPETRKDIETFINTMAGDGLLAPRAQFEIIKAAGGIKMTAAVGKLQKVLNEDRRTRIIMEAAAWSIFRITGQMPQIPEPKPNEGEWVVRRTRD